MPVPPERPSGARQRAAPTLIGGRGDARGGAVLPWLRVEDGIFFGSIDRLPDRLDAWQRFGWEDVALPAVILVAVTGLGRGQASVGGPGLARLSVGGPPGAGADVALAASAAGLIVALATLSEQRREATV